MLLYSNGHFALLGLLALALPVGVFPDVGSFERALRGIVVTIDETHHAWIYSAVVLAGLAVLVLLPTRRGLSREERQKYTMLQLAALLGAIVGAKLSAVVGDFGWPWLPLPGGWHHTMESGRSAPGAILGGFLFAEVARRILRYDSPPNDRFAVRLPFALAILRVGCVLGGCCRGVSYGGPLALRYSDGVARVPASMMELAFQFAVGLTFAALLRKNKLSGGLLALYMILYGIFRFALEPLREPPKLWAGFPAVNQGVALALVAFGLASLYFRVLRVRSQPLQVARSEQ
jgi:phosphatidylglycerol:prolipoprotein diacylglycerol transferase